MRSRFSAHQGMSAYALLAALFFSLQACSSSSNTSKQTAITVALPGGSDGIGFDDLRFSSRLHRVLAPAGQTGKLDLVDPNSHAITTISGFSSEDRFGGGHGEGITSVDEGRDLLFAIDRTAEKVHVIDPAARSIVGSADLSAGPDYVRYVEANNELWVTEPDSDQIEVFTLPPGDRPTPKPAALIPVPGGPEALVIDGTRGRAYTNLWKGETVAIDLSTRSVVAQWPNGCDGSRGLALDEKRGLLFVGCTEGKAAVLDVNDAGRQLSSMQVGSGVDIIGYNSSLSHLYVPSAATGTMSILRISEDGKLSLLATVNTVQGAHCVTVDDLGNAWVCDPKHGELLVFKDRF